MLLVSLALRVASLAPARQSSQGCASMTSSATSSPNLRRPFRKLSGKSANSLRSQVAGRSGCAKSKHALITSTTPSPLCASVWTLCSLPRSRPWKRIASCQTGPCQRLQDQWGSGSIRLPSQSHSPGESVGSSQLPGKRQKPSFHRLRKRLRNVISNMTNFREVLFWSIFSVAKVNILSRNFVAKLFSAGEEELLGPEVSQAEKDAALSKCLSSQRSWAARKPKHTLSAISDVDGGPIFDPDEAARRGLTCTRIFSRSWDMQTCFPIYHAHSKFLAADFCRGSAVLSCILQ